MQLPGHLATGVSVRATAAPRYVELCDAFIALYGIQRTEQAVMRWAVVGAAVGAAVGAVVGALVGARIYSYTAYWGLAYCLQDAHFSR